MTTPNKMKLKFFLLMLMSLFLLPLNSQGMQHEHAASGTKTDCDINTGPCAKTIELDNLKVILDINPKPVNPMADLLFNVTLKEGEKPVTDAAVSIDLTMPGMFMGINRPALKHVKDGSYEGKGVIPVCPHGGKRWKADVTVERNGKAATVSYIFEVK